MGVSVQEQKKEVCTPSKSVGVGVGRFGPWGNETGCQVVGVAMDKTQRIEVCLACTLVGLDVGVEGVAGPMRRASWWRCCCKLVAYLILSTSIGCAHIVPGIAPNAPTHPCCKHLMGSIVVMVSRNWGGAASLSELR